jgi:uncharacterized protein
MLVNIATSLLWLFFFQFGPLERLGRSLTYWQLQPLRINRPQAPQPEEALN